MAQMQWVGQLADRNAPVAEAISGASANVGNAIIDRRKQQVAAKQQQFENIMKEKELAQKVESERPYAAIAEQQQDKMVFDLVGKELSSAWSEEDRNAVINRWAPVLDETTTGKQLVSKGMKLSDVLRVHTNQSSQPPVQTNPLTSVLSGMGNAIMNGGQRQPDQSVVQASGISPQIIQAYSKLREQGYSEEQAKQMMGIE